MSSPRISTLTQENIEEALYGGDVFRPDDNSSSSSDTNSVVLVNLRWMFSTHPKVLHLGNISQVQHFHHSFRTRAPGSLLPFSDHQFYKTLVLRVVTWSGFPPLPMVLLSHFRSILATHRAVQMLEMVHLHRKSFRVIWAWEMMRSVRGFLVEIPWLLRNLNKMDSLQRWEFLFHVEFTTNSVMG